MERRRLQVAISIVFVVVMVSSFVILRTSGERSTAGHATGAPTQTPNVLLIIADDMGIDKIGSYGRDAYQGYPEEAGFLPDTPVLDDLAEVGVRFTDAWANPTCSPTRAALFTGNHGFRTGVGMPIGRANASVLEYSETTLAETLKLEGYTSGMFGKWHLGEKDAPEGWWRGDDIQWEAHIGEVVSFEAPPLIHGWDMFSGTITGAVDSIDGDGYYRWTAVENDRCEGCRESNRLEVRQVTEYATIQSVSDALTWANRQSDAGLPWMVSLTLNAPHSPFELPPEGCSYRPEGAEAPLKNQPAIYEEMVECMDIQVGILLENIDDLENTLVIFVGDNGTAKEVAEGRFDDGRGKGTVYESGVRVPLIIADGAAILRTADPCATAHCAVHEPGVVTNAPAHVVDLFATIAEVVGARSDTSLDGVSLVPLLSDVGGPARASLYAESFSRDGSGSFALRRGDWKLTGKVTTTDGEACLSTYSLFNVAEDRWELEDLEGSLAQNAAAEGAMSALLQELDTMAASAEEPPWFAADACP